MPRVAPLSSEPRIVLRPTAPCAEDPPKVVRLKLRSSEPYPFQQGHIDALGTATGWPKTRFVRAGGALVSWRGSRTPAGIDQAEPSLESARARG